MFTSQKRKLSVLRNVSKTSAVVKKQREEELEAIHIQETLEDLNCEPCTGLKLERLSKDVMVKYDVKLPKKRQHHSLLPKYKCNICYKNDPMTNSHTWRHIEMYHKNDPRYKDTIALKGKKAIVTPLFARVDHYVENNLQDELVDQNDYFHDKDGEKENDQNIVN